MNSLLLNGTAYGTLPAIVDPADGITAVTPTSLSALVIKNGTDTADLVTITAVGGGRTGVYKWSYNPAGEVEGDSFSLVFTITIASADYFHTVDLTVKAPERGTDGASTHGAPDLSNLDATISSRSSHGAPDLSNLDAAVSSRSSHAAPDLSNLDVAISTRAAATLTAAAIVAELKSDATFAQLVADATLAAAEIQRVPRGAGAIAAGAAVSKTNNSATPAQTISETINGAA